MSSQYIPNRRGTPTRIGIKARKRIMQAWQKAQKEQLEADAKLKAEAAEGKKDEN